LHELPLAGIEETKTDRLGMEDGQTDGKFGGGICGGKSLNRMGGSEEPSTNKEGEASSKKPRGLG